MQSLPNSRKLSQHNGLSLGVCPLEDKEYNTAIVANSDYDHSVSKSLKNFFKKLRGVNISTIATNNTSSTTTTITACSTPITATTRTVKNVYRNDSYNNSLITTRPKKKKMMMIKSNKNYYLPTINSNEIAIAAVTVRSSRTNNNRNPQYRHTLDLSNFMNNTLVSDIKNNDSGIIIKKRTNSLLLNDTSIYSTFSSSCSKKSFISISTSSTNTSNIDKNNEDILTQKRLWNEDITLCPKEEIAQWLGSKPSTRSKILYLYMNNFDFSNKKLDDAFRMLCLKLYIKGESQQLDRIIEAFAKRYYECNPTTLFHSVDVVHAITYSLLLLNTDLHVVSDWSNKMSRTNFIKNTMETIKSIMFPHLDGNNSEEEEEETAAQGYSKQRKRRASLVSHQSSSNDSLFNTDDNTIINKLDALKSNISWKTTYSHHHQSLSRTQKNWLIDIENLLKGMYSAVKSRRIDQALTNSTAGDAAIVITAAPTNTNAGTEFQPLNSTSFYRSRTLPKNTTSTNQKTRQLSNAATITTATTVMSPLKQGLVMRKHVMESADKRARHRQWQLCYLVMNETQLIMYKPTHYNLIQPQHCDSNKENQNNKSRRRRRRSMILWNQSLFSLQDIIAEGGGEIEDWKADQEQSPLGTLEMNHTFASVVPPPGWNDQRPHVFRLETADGGLWLFESTDMYAIQAWVEASNQTAAKISKGPLTGAVCNIDYGWGNNNLSANVLIWHPPTPCMIRSELDINQQYHDIESQIRVLNEQLDQHRQLKLALDKKFSSANSNGGINSVQALTNWDKKLHYLLHELIKARCYKDCLFLLLS